MYTDPQFFIYLTILGSTVGILAGLLGIGGGGIMVPMLTSLFLAYQAPKEIVVHLALGTSMSTIAITSLMNAYSHNKRQGVLWNVVKSATPGIAVGVVLASVIINYVNTLILAGFFSLFMGFIAFQLFKTKKENDPVEMTLPSQKQLSLFGVSLGLLSTLVSIGGGSISVPYLLKYNTSVNKAIGTSAALGAPIAFFGSIGYFVLGHYFNETHSSTYIYFPAVLVLAIASSACIPIGVKLGYKMPVKVLKKLFSILLFVLSIKMLISIL